MKAVKSGLAYFLIAAFALIVSTADASAQYYYDVNNGTITSGNGVVVGVVQGGVAINVTSGLPLSQDPGITQVTGTDDNVYTIGPDGRLTANQNNNNNNNNNNPNVPINLGGGGESGGGGGGGGGGGSGGGGGGGGGGGSGSGSSGGAGGVASNGGGGGGGEEYAALVSEGLQETGVDGEVLAVAAADNEDSDSGSSTSKSVARSVGSSGLGDGKLNDRVKTLDGWSQLFSGTRSSPVIVDYTEKLKEQYPENYVSQKDQKNRPSLGMIFGQQKEFEITQQQNLGTDDEILKTSMAVYQPISQLQKDFLMDEKRRDDYLDSGLTKRGIAIMTMGFLDKTVGAGLTAVQAQADQDTTAHLLKQIGWSTSKLANPDRASFYRDVDEKMEQCLLEARVKNAPKKDVKGDDQSRKWVDFKCAKICGNPPTEDKYKEDSSQTSSGGSPPRVGNGSYRWCECCAEQSNAVNKMWEDNKKLPGEGSADTRQQSVIERVLFGTLQPTENDKANSLEKVKKIAERFKRVYGDYFLDKRSEPNTDNPDDDKPLRYIYMFPKYSVQRYIMGFRDSDDSCTGNECPIDGKSENADIKKDLKLEKGICPSLAEILKKWDTISKSNSIGGFARDWAEASLGFLLTGRDINGFLALNGTNLNKLDSDAEGRMKRIILDFCDASAVAAFTRFHIRMGTILNDHMTLNSQVSAMDKAKVMQLYNRVTQQLDMAKMDIAASSGAQNILLGVSINKDRRDTAASAAAVSSAIAMLNQASQSGSNTAFGAATNYISNGGGGGGTGTGRAAVNTDRLDREVSQLPDALDDILPVSSKGL